MRDPRRTPVIDGQVHACDLRKSHLARFPVGREIGRCAVVTISHVVDGDLVAVDVGPRCLHNIRLPCVIVAWFQRQPPRNNNRECTKDNGNLQKFPANKYDDREQCDYKQNRCERAGFRKIKIECAKSPCGTDECDQPRETPAYEFDHAHAKQGETPFRRTLLRRYCFGRPFIVSRLPSLIWIETILARKTLQCIRAKIFLINDAVGPNDKRLDACDPILSGRRSESESADHYPLHDKVHLSQWCSRTLPL